MSDAKTVSGPSAARREPRNVACVTRRAHRTIVAARDAIGVVSVVDDDASVRRALARLLRMEGFDVEMFASGAELLASDAAERSGCVILDLGMPHMGGLEVYERLRGAGLDPAVVFLTAYGDVPTSVHAMKAGAVDFLEKPCDAAALLTAIHRALARDAAARAARAARDRLLARHRALTPREREVLALVVTGLPNKLVADRLGTSEKTVKVHRGRVMMKMAVRSFADLVRLGEALGVRKDPGPTTL